MTSYLNLYFISSITYMTDDFIEIIQPLHGESRISCWICICIFCHRRFDLKLSNGRSRYIIHITPASWHYARRFCHAFGYHLVKIDNAAEQNYITGKIRMFGKVIILIWRLGLLRIHNRMTLACIALSITYFVISKWVDADKKWVDVYKMSVDDCKHLQHNSRTSGSDWMILM